MSFQRSERVKLKKLLLPISQNIAKNQILLISLTIIDNQLRNCNFFGKKLEQKIIATDDDLRTLHFRLEEIFPASSGDILYQK